MYSNKYCNPKQKVGSYREQGYLDHRRSSAMIELISAGLLLKKHYSVVEPSAAPATVTTACLDALSINEDVKSSEIFHLVADASQALTELAWSTEMPLKQPIQDVLDAARAAVDSVKR